MDYHDISDSDDELLGLSRKNIEERNNIKCKYKKIKEIIGVLGYIVHIHDGTNFDIDLFFPEKDSSSYSTAIKNEYYYHNVNSDYFKTGNFESNEVKRGVAYRCRLRGIGVNKLSSNAHMRKNCLMAAEIRKMIDRSDGWVVCNISDIDIYQRLLVDIKIRINGEIIDLKRYLLKRMEDEDWTDNPIFHQYPKTALN